MSHGTARDLEARERFLDEAASALMPSCPALSAFIGAQALRYAAVQDTDISENRQTRCNACGISLILGWSCKKVRRSLNKKRRTRVGQSSLKHKTALVVQSDLAYRCLTCSSETAIVSRTKAAKGVDENRSESSTTRQLDPISGTPTKGLQSIPSEVIVAESAGRTTVADDSQVHKKRSRTKKQGGLQAMLAKSKSSAPAKTGFDFMYFMKSN